MGNMNELDPLKDGPQMDHDLVHYLSIVGSADGHIDPMFGFQSRSPGK